MKRLLTKSLKHVSLFCIVIFCMLILCSCCITTPAKFSPLQRKYDELAEKQRIYWSFEYPERKDNFVHLYNAFCAFHDSSEIPINEKMIMMYLGKPDNIFKNKGYLLFIYRVKEYKIRFVVILKDNAIKTMQLRDSDKALLEEIYNNKNSVPVTESELNKIILENKTHKKQNEGSSTDG